VRLVLDAYGHISPIVWCSPEDLGLPVALADEWVSYTNALTTTGLKLLEREDAPIWIGGDLTGRTTVFKHLHCYLKSLLAAFNYNWRKKLWHWNMPLKIKLFTWLSLENKINTWDILCRKGRIGPSICLLCHGEEESSFHIFVTCPFTRRVWDRISVALHYTHFGMDLPYKSATRSGSTIIVHIARCLPSLPGTFGCRETIPFSTMHSPPLLQ
jgi:hypothetical protein